MNSAISTLLKNKVRAIQPKLRKRRQSTGNGTRSRSGVNFRASSHQSPAGSNNTKHRSTRAAHSSPAPQRFDGQLRAAQQNGDHERHHHHPGSNKAERRISTRDARTPHRTANDDRPGTPANRDIQLIPSRASRPCQQPGCPELISDGSRCEKHRAEHQRNQRRWRGTAASRG